MRTTELSNNLFKGITSGRPLQHPHARTAISNCDEETKTEDRDRPLPTQQAQLKLGNPEPSNPNPNPVTGTQ